MRAGIGLLLLFAVATSSVTHGATSSTVVGASVPASVALDDSGCTASGSRHFGSFLPGSNLLSTPCRIDFRSSNESAMLRLSRRSGDPARPAMTQESWTFATQRAATGVPLNDIDDYSRNVAWAVGDGGAILATTNGGSTWPAQASGVANNLNTVRVVDASNIWVVGDGGRVLRTTNGGTNWTIVNAGTAANLRDIDVQDNTVWIAGDGGVLLRSDDSGATWTSMIGPVTGDVDAVEAVTESIVLVGTDTPARIWRSTNRGTSWTQVVNTGAVTAWLNLDSPSPSVVYAGGTSNHFARSADAGATWTIRGDAWTEGDDVEALDANVAYQADITGNVDRTYDALATLPFHPSQVGAAIFNGRITGLAVPAIDDIWFTGDNGIIGRSVPAAAVSDYAGGSNWGSGTSTSTFGVCVQFLGATTTPVWAADNTGVIGTCESNDGDTWRAVPATPTKIAQTAVSAQGRIDLVWGMRAGSGQAAGRYFAPVTFEVVAPAV